VVLGLFCAGALAAYAKGPAPDRDQGSIRPTLDLTTARDRQSVVVQAFMPTAWTRDVTGQATYAFGNKALARIDKAVLYPLWRTGKRS